jgi:DNA-binding XRE family transcriptional regulator
MTDETIDGLIEDLRRDKEYDESFAIVELVRATGDMLTRMRQRAKMSQTEMAEALGITPGRVWQLESGTLRNAPSLKSIARWAKACGEVVELAPSGERDWPRFADDAVMHPVRAPVTVGKPLAGRAWVPVHVDVRSFGKIRIAGGGEIDSRAVAVVETATAKALKAAGLAHVGVVAGVPRVVGDHVELSLTLVSEKPEPEVETR